MTTSASTGPRLARAVAVAVILGATLFAAPAAPAGNLPWVCIVCGERGLADALLNIALFVPLGIALAGCGYSTHATLMQALVLSVSVEVIQTVIPGRDSTLGDVVFNTLGAAAGSLIFTTRRWWLHPSEPLALRLSLLATAAATAVFAFTAYALQPSFPRTHYYGQWTPDLGHLEWYRGEVTRATLGPLSMPSRRLSDSDSVRSLLASEASLAVLAVAGPRTRRLASLFSIFDDHRREILLIGPDRDDLVYRYRTRAVDLRLDQPDLRSVGALAGLIPGDTFRVSLRSGRSGRCIALNSDARCGLRFSLGTGWGLLLYEEALPSWLKAVLNLVWVTLVVLPAGFWSLRWRTSAFAGVTVLAALVVLPAFSHLAFTPPGEYAGAVLGVVIGLGFRRYVSLRRSG